MRLRSRELSTRVLCAAYRQLVLTALQNAATQWSAHAQLLCALVSKAVVRGVMTGLHRGRLALSVADDGSRNSSIRWALRLLESWLRSGMSPGHPTAFLLCVRVCSLIPRDPSGEDEDDLSLPSMAADSGLPSAGVLQNAVDAGAPLLDDGIEEFVLPADTKADDGAGPSTKIQPRFGGGLFGRKGGSDGGGAADHLKVPKQRRSVVAAAMKFSWERDESLTARDAKTKAVEAARIAAARAADAVMEKPPAFQTLTHLWRPPM